MLLEETIERRINLLTQRGPVTRYSSAGARRSKVVSAKMSSLQWGVVPDRALVGREPPTATQAHLGRPRHCIDQFASRNSVANRIFGLTSCHSHERLVSLVQ